MTVTVTVTVTLSVTQTQATAAVDGAAAPLASDMRTLTLTQAAPPASDMPTSASASGERASPNQR